MILPYTCCELINEEVLGRNVDHVDGFQSSTNEEDLTKCHRCNSAISTDRFPRSPEINMDLYFLVFLYIFHVMVC